MLKKLHLRVADAINVKSVGSQTLSPDGRHLAAIVADGRARFGTDHFRFRDPSYLNVRAGELVLINTRTGEKIKPFTGQVRVTRLTWNDDSDKLYFFQQEEDRMVLKVYEVGKKVKVVKVKDDRLLAPNLGIHPSPDGKSLVVGMRKQGWFDQAMATYKEATEGPIVVYDGSEDFLKWDKIGKQSSMAEVVQIDLKNGQVTDLLPESAYSGLRWSIDNQYLSYN